MLYKKMVFLTSNISKIDLFVWPKLAFSYMFSARELCENGDVSHDGPLGLHPKEKQQKRNQKGQMENSLYNFHLTLWRL